MSGGAELAFTNTHFSAEVGLTISTSTDVFSCGKPTTVWIAFGIVSSFLGINHDVGFVSPASGMVISEFTSGMF